MDKVQKVAIIGGGLGGLTFAQSLKNSGFDVTVYERDLASDARAQGFLIGINSDGLKALHSLQLDDVEKLLQVNKTFGFAIVDGNLKLMMELKDEDGCLVDRWKLRKMLTQDLHIEWNKRFTFYEEFEDKVVAHFEDGTFVEADILVGADGAKSRVREQRCPKTLVYEDVGVTSVAGCIPLPKESTIPLMFPLVQKNPVRVLASKGNTVLLLAFQDDHGQQNLLWVITHSTGDNKYPQDLKDLKKVVVERAKEINPEVLFVVENTPEESFIHVQELHSMKALVSNPLDPISRVTLLGDAAHAMTTHRGLGANTAFLDAIDLSNALQSPNWSKELEQYHQVLFKRGMTAVQESLRSTKMITSTSFARNLAISAIGNLLWLKRKLF